MNNETGVCQLSQQVGSRFQSTFDDVAPTRSVSHVLVLNTLHESRICCTSITGPQPGREHDVLEPGSLIETRWVQKLPFEKLVFRIGSANLVVKLYLLPPLPPREILPKLIS